MARNKEGVGGKAGHEGKGGTQCFGGGTKLEGITGFYLTGRDS